MSNYGMGQNFNPHALKTGIIKEFDSKWYEEESDCVYLFENSTSFNSFGKKLSNGSNITIYSSSFLNRKSGLEKNLGKNRYKKMIKILGR